MESDNLSFQWIRQNIASIITYNNLTLRNLVIKNKLVTKNILLSSGVYKLKCNDFFFMLGNVRIKKTIKYSKHSNLLSNVAKHMHDNKHNCNLNILQEEPKKAQYLIC